MALTFKGYLRSDGRVGIRNQVAVLSVMDNTNPTAHRIVDIVNNTILISTPFGRGQFGYDRDMTHKTLAGLATHPNVAAVLVLSLSMETAQDLVQLIEPCGKPTRALGLQESGGTLNLTASGAKIAAELVSEASELQRQARPISDLVVGVECGGSDATSGLASNPAVGSFADRLVDAGGTIVLSEPAEFMGAEHILAERAVSKKDKQRIIEMVKWFENEALRQGLDMQKTNPTPDNIAGGLTTLEEKSLGAIAKGGTRPITQTLAYAEQPSQKGLVVMNTPSAACESMSGLAAGGCQIVIFSTGRGNAIGATEICPTIKVTGNPNTVNSMSENIDLDLSSIITENESIDQAGERVWDLVVKVANGKCTSAEILGECQLSVSRWGLSV
jgi:altronate dehydratase large subunit